MSFAIQYTKCITNHHKKNKVRKHVIIHSRKKRQSENKTKRYLNMRAHDSKCTGIAINPQAWVLQIFPINCAKCQKRFALFTLIQTQMNLY